MQIRDIFKEQVIFELEKTKPIMGAKKFKSYCLTKYGYDYTTGIRAKIINWQLDTYGGTITNERYKKDFRYYEKLSADARKRKYERKKRYGE